jgi:hypothetical protein
LHRQLRDLDRWYRDLEAPRRARGEAWRRFFVTSATSVVAVVASLVVLHQQGIVVRFDGVGRLVGRGPSVSPEGARGSYRFLATQPSGSRVPVSYNPCKPIHVVVNDDLAPASADALLDSALDRVAEVTGLTFVRDGRTDELPSSDRPAEDPGRYGRGWSPVLVAWTTPEIDHGLEGDVVGLGGSTRVSDTISGRLRYVTGTIALDTPAMRRVLQRSDGVLAARAIVMHELGHVVGLGHVDDPGELMYDDNVGRTDFGPGDLRGLAILGRGACAG